jgi:anaerobic sulfite reductase subunit C
MSQDTPSVDLKALKAGGFIKQKQADLFVIRLRTPLGDISGEQLKKVAEVSEKYGNKKLHLTVRQGIEIPFIHLKDFDAAKTELSEAGLALGACGPRVRVVIGCPGAAVCRNGLTDTYSLGKKLDDYYFGRGDIPHKFKIAVTGCPRACAKPQENDVGFMGVVKAVLQETDEKECISCGLCEEVCPSGAIRMVNGKPEIDQDKCFHDGDCISVCPTEVLITERKGWRVFVGGRFGRRPKLGQTYEDFISDDRAFELVEKFIQAFAHLADKGERLGAMIDRLSLNKFREEVESGSTR